VGGHRLRGRVEDDAYIHVKQSRLSGWVALCGAGQIVEDVPGWYDPDDPRACVLCTNDM